MTTKFGEGPDGPSPILLAAKRRLEMRRMPVTAERIFDEVKGFGVSRRECEEFAAMVRQGQGPRRGHDAG